MNYGGAAIHVPDRGWVVVLLILGAACQVAGILTVVVELSRSRHDARKLGRANPGGPEAPSVFDQRGDIAPMLGRVLRASRWRIVGVVLLIIGVVLATAGGVWSAYLAPAGPFTIRGKQ